MVLRPEIHLQEITNSGWATPSPDESGSESLAGDKTFDFGVNLK